MTRKMKWTVEDDAELRNRYGTVRVVELAIQMKRTQEAVRRWATVLKLTKPRGTVEVTS